MGTHADYVAAVAQSCTSLYTRLATHRPVVALRTHLQPRMHDLTSTSRASGVVRRDNVKSFGKKHEYIEIIETLKHTSAILQVSVDYFRSTTPHENLGVRVRLGNKRRSRLYYPSVGSHQGVFRWCCTSSIRLLTQPTIAESIRRFSFYATKLWVG